jgi:two-component system cell cycle response regulator DivK
MDGYGFARWVRADPRWARVPLVAATSYAMPGDRARALAVGFDAYFEKPLDPAGFGAAVRALAVGSPVAPDEGPPP